jgi:subtilase family serine protease
MNSFQKFSIVILTLFIGVSIASAKGPSAIALNHIPVCPGPTQDAAHCHSRVVIDKNGQPNVTPAPSGYGTVQFHSAYTSTVNAPSKTIIAIVDAYDNPNVLSDLNTYSDSFGIPRLAGCTTSITNSATPCFQKIDQRGGTRLPRTNSGWALEIALDVEVAHAMCQNCSILLVEADSNSFSNLLAAEDRAGLMGAKIISNSWGGNEFSGETSSTYDGHFNKPGIEITVSSGDSGYGTEFPAASKYVTAVGGTTLNLNGGAYAIETAWNGAGSGCSSYESIPSWQVGITDSLCAGHRMVADVSADADPNTGAAVYDSVNYQGQKGWFQVGGTSLSSPLIAGIYALAGGSVSPSLPYTKGSASNLHDVISGNNGSCGGSYLCTALTGYDGPTGLGSPNGLGAF